MTRPSVDDVADALGVLGALVDDGGGGEEERALQVLAAAAVPRVPMPSKEFAELIGVSPQDLRKSRTNGLPEPAAKFPRGVKGRPNQEVRLWWRDDGVAFNEAKGGK